MKGGEKTTKAGTSTTNGGVAAKYRDTSDGRQCLMFILRPRAPDKSLNLASYIYLA